MKTRLFFTALTLILGTQVSDAQSGIPALPDQMSNPFPAASQVEQAEEIDLQDIVLPNLLGGGGSEIVVNSTGSGSWSDGLNWDCGCSPTLIHEVHILDGHHIEMTADQMVATLVIEEGGTLSIVTESEIETELTLYNSLYNQGTLNADAATLRIDDNGNVHHIAGDNSFKNIELASAGTVILESPTTVYGRIDLVATTLSSEGNLRLVFGDDAFHGIGEFVSSSIEGNIVLERTFDHPINTYLDLSPGVSMASFEQWNDDFLTSGFPGSDYPASTFVSVLAYNETQTDESNAFFGPDDISSEIPATSGHYVYALAGEYTVDTEGAAITGAQHFNLTFTEQEDNRFEGFQFVGNPFAATISTQNDEGWVRNNVGRAIYQWQNATAQFETYVRGIGVNGGDGRVSMMDGFWVKATGADPTMQINEMAKVIDVSEEVYNDQSLSMTVSNGVQSDEVAMAFNEECTDAFDQEWDAQKFFSASINAELAWAGEDLPLCIQRVHPDVYNKNYPVLLTVREAGTYSIQVMNQLQTELAACMILEDMVTGEVYDLQGEINFDITSEEVVEQERFILRVGAAISPVNGLTTCHDDFDGEITLEGTGEGPWNYTWSDEDGNVIREMEDLPMEDVMSNLAPGNYTIVVDNNDLCASLEVTAEVAAPPAIEFFSSFQNIPCGEDNTGSIEIEVTGGVEPYTYDWSNGSEGNMLFNLAGGEYTLNLTDANGCVLLHDFTIDEAADVTASFDFSDTNIPLINGQAVVEFSNTSEGADDIYWTFGDGSDMSNVDNPMHIYTETGIYVVALTASNEDCEDTFQVIVQVEEGTGIEELLESSFNVMPVEGGWTIETNWPNGYTEIDVYNLLGQRLMDTWTGNLGKDRITLYTDDHTGAYLIQLRRNSDDWIHTIKRVK